jgi:hypothetical protein
MPWNEELLNFITYSGTHWSGQLNGEAGQSHELSLQLSVGGDPELSAMAGPTRHSGLITKGGGKK